MFPPPSRRHSANNLLQTLLPGVLWLACVTPGHPEGNLAEALRTGKPSLFLRYRYESVDQDGIAKKAQASTLKSNLGYQTGSWNSLGAYLEFEGVSRVGDIHYNLPAAVPASVTRDRTRPVVADPEGAEINQSYLMWKGTKNALKLGRQQIILGNARFVGNVGWRQNEQTFDALRWDNSSWEKTSLSLIYLENVNRIFRDNNRMNSWVADLAHRFDPGKLRAYTLLLNYKDATGLQDRSTWGMRWEGTASQKFKFLYNLDFATQSDSGDNKTSVDAIYWCGEMEIGSPRISALLGIESLGSDNGKTAFATPLATLHAFNGWADMFLATSVAGLRDSYAGLNTAPVKKVSGSLVFHRFEADFGGTDYGSETDAVVTWAALEGMQLGLKYADFNAETASGLKDVSKFWLWTQYKI